jgi:hypothetical protein
MTAFLYASRRRSLPELLAMRVWHIDGFTNHLLFCPQIEGGIEIVRVWHGLRDIKRAFESGDPG